ncbi:hypothetical protein PFICI_13119 [Pestalotiopsis fici W106-1]|uniref:Ricin B lectin domain-containing protein n=1 Tax=Pestalotiopsis fici (strain W106-1 / CGMCC3.15140) TaxID=1229662 RepID=W3WL42_PESFW|nr:uncharacterized protein PFICI_13119 [Pestalotiopsis fici W106-1]ETS74635.1 hypothetical protein PFICI_13119 [Pestalotiopsis fici W106-1]
MSPVRNNALVSFTNYSADLCIDQTDGNPADGTPVIGHRYNGYKHQQWRLQNVGTTGPWPIYIIKNEETGSYLDLTNGKADNGTKITTWHGGDTINPNQHWRFITGDPANPNTVMIQNVRTGTFVDLFEGRKLEQTPIVGWNGDFKNLGNIYHQQWKVQDV